MIPRTLETNLLKVADQYPVVTLTGPRQSGKTTLLRSTFPHHRYVTLEDPDLRDFALEDPRGFLDQFSGPIILDEVQRTPCLFSYLQTRVDHGESPGKYLLSGSQNFLLLQSISQSLAGRCAIRHLLPFSLSELERREPFPATDIGRRLPSEDRWASRSLMDTLFSGFYPRIHDRRLDPADWLRNYYQTYVERDVREILHIGDLETFGRFIRLCAGRNGQLLNLTSLAADSGITHTTARRWLSALETSFIVMLLRPYHSSFNKRLIKSPKLYFIDTGLLCYLLRIRSADELFLHSSRGGIFESFVIVEFLKSFLHRGLEPDLYFWRDSAGHEVDVLIDHAGTQVPVEVKSGQTVASDFFDGLRYWLELAGRPEGPSALVHGGHGSYTRNGTSVYSWCAL